VPGCCERPTAGVCSLCRVSESRSAVDGDVEGHELASVAVSDDGVVLRAPGSEDFPVDVLFDGRRIASFWIRRDTESHGVRGEVVYAWPTPLRRFLDGTTDLSLVDHVSGAELYRSQVGLDRKSVV